MFPIRTYIYIVPYLLTFRFETLKKSLTFSKHHDTFQLDGINTTHSPIFISNTFHAGSVDWETESSSRRHRRTNNSNNKKFCFFVVFHIIISSFTCSPNKFPIQISTNELATLFGFLEMSTLHGWFGCMFGHRAYVPYIKYLSTFGGWKSKRWKCSRKYELNHLFRAEMWCGNLNYMCKHAPRERAKVCVRVFVRWFVCLFVHACSSISWDIVI